MSVVVYWWRKGRSVDPKLRLDYWGSSRGRPGGFSVVQLEIYAVVIAVLVTGVVLWLRWRKTDELAESEVSSA